MLETILQLFDYNWWADCRMLEAAKDLTPVELDRDLGGSFPSVRATLLHLFWVEGLFIRRWRGRPTTDIPQPPALDTVAAIRSAWEEIERDRKELLGGLKEPDLDRPLSYVDTRGRTLSVPLIQTLIHLANHSTFHRGQLASKLRQLGKTPPATDFIVFCRESQ